jgi:hypothetical protein
MSRSFSVREAEALANEITRLQSLGIEQLKARWRTLYKTEAPARFSRDLLIGAVAYRMQERALGGLRPATRRLFERVVGDAQARRPLNVGPVRKLEPGAVLIREWGGIKHRVMVRESGFSFGGKEYRSLSEVARVITGTRWSGPLFFGLKKRAQAEAGDEPD